MLRFLFNPNIPGILSVCLCSSGFFLFIIFRIDPPTCFLVVVLSWWESAARLEQEGLALGFTGVVSVSWSIERESMVGLVIVDGERGGMSGKIH